MSDAQQPGHAPDALGRVPPGSVPGWGASWWIYEQGVTPAALAAMTAAERAELLDRYRAAEAAGWAPGVPREQWVGPHDPAEPSAVAAPRRAGALKGQIVIGHDFDAIPDGFEVD